MKNYSKKKFRNSVNTLKAKIFLVFMSFLSVNAFALRITGPTDIKVGQTYEYDVDVDYTLTQTWSIQGGSIVEFEGVPTNQIYSFGSIRDNTARPTIEYDRGFYPGGSEYAKIYYYSVEQAGRNDLNYHTGETVKIKVRWSSSTGRLDASIYKTGYIGVGGGQSTSLEVKDCSLIVSQNIGIALNKTSMKCTEGVQAEIKPYVWGYTYTWSSPDATKTSDWISGANFEGVNTGTGKAKIICTINGSLGGTGACALNNVIKEAYVNVENVKPPTIVNKDNYSPVDNTVLLRCDDTYSLLAPYFNPKASYSWSVNGKVLSTTSSLNGSIYSDRISDINGTLTTSGICGTQTQDFVIPKITQISLPQFVSTCDLTYEITAYVPKGEAIYDWYAKVGGIDFKLFNNKQSAKITVSTPGKYTIYLATSKNCGGLIQTDITFGETKGIMNTGTLSKYRFTSASELAVVEKPGDLQDVYFVGRDAYIYKYYFDVDTKEWLLTKTDLVTDAKVSSNTLEPLVYNHVTNELIYKASNGSHIAVHISTKVKRFYTGLSDAVSLKVLKSTNSTTNGTVYGVSKDNKLNFVTPLSNLFNFAQENLQNSSIYANSWGHFYFKNNDLYLNSKVLVTGANPLATTLIEATNTHVYYTAADGKLWQVKISNPSNKVLMSDNVMSSGTFVLLKEADHLYFGSHEGSDYVLYESNLVNGTQVVSKVTARKNDAFFASPVFKYPHVYYVTGSYTEDSYTPNAVWNVYQNSGCVSVSPVVPTTTTRKANVEIKETASVFSVYPNPTQDNLTIQLDNATQDEVSAVDVFDLAGAKVASFTEPTISLEKQEAGMYLIVVKTQKGNVYQQKVVKK